MYAILWQRKTDKSKEFYWMIQNPQDLFISNPTVVFQFESYTTDFVLNRETICLLDSQISFLLQFDTTTGMSQTTQPSNTSNQTAVRLLVLLIFNRNFNSTQSLVFE